MMLSLLLSLGVAQLPPSSFLTLPVNDLLGPPAVCQPFAIGEAPSLPWREGAFGIDPDYPQEKLIPEVRKLLDQQDDALVRMETLRRAVIYAVGVGKYSGKTSPSAALRKTHTQALVLMLQQRALAVHLGAEPASATQAMPPLFDLGYALSALRQLDGVSKVPTGFGDGEAELRKSAGWSQASAAMHLGAGLGLWLSKDSDLRDQHFLQAAQDASQQSSAFQENLTACAKRFFNLESQADLVKHLKRRLAQA